MSEYRSELDTRLVDELKDLHQLLAEFVYYSDILGREVRVPAGFVTDFASIPRIFVAYLLFGGKGKKAAVIHDWLYSTQNCDRETADRVLVEAMQVSGYSKPTRWFFFQGVRIGGGSHWSKPNVPQEPHIEPLMAA